MCVFVSAWCTHVLMYMCVHVSVGHFLVWTVVDRSTMNIAGQVSSRHTDSSFLLGVCSPVGLHGRSIFIFLEVLKLLSMMAALIYILPALHTATFCSACYSVLLMLWLFYFNHPKVWVVVYDCNMHFPDTWRCWVSFHACRAFQFWIILFESFACLSIRFLFFLWLCIGYLYDLDFNCCQINYCLWVFPHMPKAVLQRVANLKGNLYVICWSKTMRLRNRHGSLLFD